MPLLHFLLLAFLSYCYGFSSFRPKKFDPPVEIDLDELRKLPPHEASKMYAKTMRKIERQKASEIEFFEPKQSSVDDALVEKLMQEMDEETRRTNLRKASLLLNLCRGQGALIMIPTAVASLDLKLAKQINPETSVKATYSSVLQAFDKSPYASTAMYADPEETYQFIFLTDPDMLAAEEQLGREQRESDFASVDEEVAWYRERIGKLIDKVQKKQQEKNERQYKGNILICRRFGVFCLPLERREAGEVARRVLGREEDEELVQLEQLELDEEGENEEENDEVEQVVVALEEMKVRRKRKSAKEQVEEGESG